MALLMAKTIKLSWKYAWVWLVHLKPIECFLLWPNNWTVPQEEVNSKYTGKQAYWCHTSKPVPRAQSFSMKLCRYEEHVSTFLFHYVFSIFENKKFSSRPILQFLKKKELFWFHMLLFFFVSKKNKDQGKSYNWQNPITNPYRLKAFDLNILLLYVTTATILKERETCLFSLNLNVADFLPTSEKP